MKLKAFFVSMIVLTMLLTGCASGTEADVPDGMQIFYNDNVDYTAFVPSDWTVDISTGTMSAYVSSADSSSVSITAQNLNEVTTLDEYWKGYEKDFKSTLSDMEYVGEAPVTTTLSGLPANRYVYTATVTGTSCKFMQVVCIREMTVYVITYTSTPEKYDDNMDNVEKILDNFSFND